MSDSTTNNAAADQVSVLEGVVFAKSIRAYYAVLHVALDDKVVIVRVQFPDRDVSSVRSWCRRCCKMGDLLQIKGHWEENTSSQRRVFVVKANEELDVLQVKKVRYMPVAEWQELQARHCVSRGGAATDAPQSKRLKRQDNKESTEKALRHGGGIGKRKQGEYLANFLIHVILHSTANNGSCCGNVDPLDWASTCVNKEQHAKALHVLNKGTGVIDAAGGSGYVSMALGLQGIQSTVVDPRESVGKLAKRDRKVWRRAIRNSHNDTMMCQPVVKPYHALRAWFAEAPPTGVDTSFRHPDEEEMPVCGSEHALLQNCSAIVALHPDEATDAIVNMAVKRRVPFVVVPCCVFSRLFVDRRHPTSGGPVSTHADLLDYLQSKHESIQRTRLPFEGANVALWSVF